MCDMTMPEKTMAERLESIDLAKIFEMSPDVRAMFINAKKEYEENQRLGAPCICPHGAHPTMCNRPQGRCC